MNRRQFLKSCSTMSVAAVSGCTKWVSPNEGSPMSLKDLQLSAEVVHQSSSNHPARIEATLSSAEGKRMRVKMGPTLLYSGGAPIPESEGIVIFPQTSVGDFPKPVRTDDGCWRVSDDKRIAVQASLSAYDVGAGQSVSEKFDVYTYGYGGECLPAGNHVFEDQISDSDETEVVDAVLTLHVSKDGRVSILGDETGIREP